LEQAAAFDCPAINKIYANISLLFPRYSNNNWANNQSINQSIHRSSGSGGGRNEIWSNTNKPENVAKVQLRLKTQETLREHSN